MVDAEPFIPIEEKHGATCTCKPIGNINIDLVAASRACPGDRNPHRAGTVTAQLERFEPPYYPGHGIVITWPAAVGDSTPLMTQLMQVHDAETGEPLLAVTGLRIALGGDNWDGGPLTVDLKMLVDADGQPLIGSSVVPVRDPDDPERFYSRVFRCYVTEMRVLPIDPTIPTRESVNRGEHTINEYRAHHGIDGARPGLAIVDEVQAVDPLDDPKNPAVRFRRGADGHIHQFPAKEPLTVPHQYAPCECGETFGGEGSQTTEENQP